METCAGILPTSHAWPNVVSDKTTHKRPGRPLPLARLAERGRRNDGYRIAVALLRETQSTIF